MGNAKRSCLLLLQLLLLQLQLLPLLLAARLATGTLPRWPPPPPPPPRLSLRVARPSARAAYVTRETRVCTTKMRMIHYTESFRCPCVLSFRAAVPHRVHHARRDELQFLLMRVVANDSVPGVPNQRYVHAASTRHARLQATSGTHNDGWATFERGPFGVSLSGRFVIAIRANVHVAHCELDLSLVMHSDLPSCPMILPTALSSPSPSPSASVTPSALPSALPLDGTSVAPRIVGGVGAHESWRAHMAAFMSRDQFSCSGSLLSPTWVLTAAHCVIRRGMLVVIGADRLPEGERRTVAAVMRHPHYVQSTDSPFDIALVRLDRAVDMDIRAVVVNVNGSVPVGGTYARVSGYGKSSETADFDAQLRQVDVPIVNMSECRRSYRSANAELANHLTVSSQICAGETRGGCDACHGDSGGPLVVMDSSGNLVQVGIVAFGIGCARADLPGVYTKLSAFETWLHQVGAAYTRSDGIVVESTYVLQADHRAGFSIAGLSVTMSALIVSAVCVACVVLIASLVLASAAWRRAQQCGQPCVASQGGHGQRTGDGQSNEVSDDEARLGAARPSWPVAAADVESQRQLGVDVC